MVTRENALPCLSLLGEAEERSFARRVLAKVYATALAIRGSYTLALRGRSVRFSAPTATAVQRNLRRFEAEQDELAAFVAEIEADDVVYDVGANTGLYSLFAAPECPDGRVIAFEPYPPNVELCERDVARNGFSNIEVVDVALSDAVGHTAFSQPKEPDVGYGSASIEAETSAGSVEVPTTTGDRLIADGEIPPPNVVKIDVEGAEPLVVEGLADALSAPSCRAVFCEVHLPGIDRRPSIEAFGTTVEAFEQRLEGLGFTVEPLHERRDAEIVYRAVK